MLLGQVRLDAFPAEQRLHNPLIRPGLILLGLLDADVSGTISARQGRIRCQPFCCGSSRVVVLTLHRLQMTGEAAPGQPGDALKRPWFLEQV